jgi:hypothetical protein
VFLQHILLCAQVYYISAYLCSLALMFLDMHVILCFQHVFYFLGYSTGIVMSYEEWFLVQCRFICTDWLVLTQCSAHVMGICYDKNKPLETCVSPLSEPQKQVDIHLLYISMHIGYNALCESHMPKSPTIVWNKQTKFTQGLYLLKLCKQYKYQFGGKNSTHAKSRL